MIGATCVKLCSSVTGIYISNVCGRARLTSEVDHIQPKSRGGRDTLVNLQALCAPCHRAKTARERGAGDISGG